MEEAETLCQRISIMAKGEMRCIADPLRLKAIYGSGYKLFINTEPKMLHIASLFIETLLPAGIVFNLRI